uniref:Uncharacterized protein n=1 Tax=Sphaeramia orbicularis TaxID=375764 RepID=A0A672ZX53_9TELE
HNVGTITLICTNTFQVHVIHIFKRIAREANHVGDRMAAERSSRTARTLNHVALGIGIGVMVLSIVYILVLVLVN